MMEKDLILKLKALRNTPEGGLPQAGVKERNWNLLLSHIQSKSVQPQTLGLLAKFGIFQYLIAPRMVYAAMMFVLLFGTGAAAFSSRGALPGEALYPAKLAVEGAKVRFTSNPASRARVQMEIAGERLREVQEITKTEEYNGRLNAALSRFAKDVGEAKKNLAQAGDPVQVKAVASEIAKKAQEYKQELTATQAFVEQKAADEFDHDSAITPDSGVVNNPNLGEIGTVLSKKPVRNVEFSAFEQAQEALKAVSQDQLAEEDPENSEDDANVEEKVEELKNGEVGL